MKKNKIERDGDSFYVDTSAGRMRSDEVGGLVNIAQSIEENQPKPPQFFLAAWQDGVRLAGESFFKVRSDTVESATHIDQLRPDLEIITASLGTLSPGERDFLLSLYQFFNDSSVRDLCNNAGYPMPSLTDIATLDAKHRSVILRLIDSYNGW